MRHCRAMKQLAAVLLLLCTLARCSQSSSLEACDCDPAGSIGCDADADRCVCAEGVTGERCDTCIGATIGPSSRTVTPCLRCFCNGIQTQCISSNNFFQAEVRSTFANGSAGFMTDGDRVSTDEGILEIETSREMLKLSFPAVYRGDKRTAYSQQLTLNLSLPNLPPNQTCSAQLRIGSRVGLERLTTLVFDLNFCSGAQYLQVPLISGTVVVDKGFAAIRANRRDVISMLSNITFVRLMVKFPSSAGPPNILRLMESRLDFAVDNQSSEAVVEPREPVNYVEECTSCGRQRTGPRCETCAPGYTTDAEFGGEFARCVRCFCSFRSESCDPNSGVCFNCTGNSEGENCERCLPGFFRVRTPIIWLSNCEDCSCNPQGSASLSCDDFSGVCECREGVTGDKCDRCEDGSGGTFPDCLQCDECHDQWQLRIDVLTRLVNNSLELAANISSANGTRNEIDSLLQDIQALLNASRIDLLSEDVESLHLRLCVLINQTQDLLSRGQLVEEQLDAIENDSETIRIELGPIVATLSQLQQEFEALAELVAGFEPFNATLQLLRAQEVIERSNRADRLIRLNVTSLLNETQMTLNQFDSLLASSDIESVQADIELRLADLSNRTAELQSFIRLANELLCGATTESCDDPCGGITCGRCGGELCDSLVTMGEEAVNISSQALALSQSLLASILQEIEQLELFLANITILRNSSLQTESFVNETSASAVQLLGSLQELIAQVRSELNTTRVDPAAIEQLENQTLSLQLLLNRDEFLDVLRLINSTIDALFVQAGVNFTELARRAMEALARAENANALAEAVAANASSLEVRLRELQAQQQDLEMTANETQQLVLAAEASVDQAESLVDGSELVLNDSRAAIANLTARLAALQQRIIVNERNLEIARNLTELAQQLANQTDADSVQVEREFESFSQVVFEALSQSERDLLTANELLNRTLSLQELTQEQLLQVEYLDRIRTQLFVEQEEIRNDISRVAAELERLDQAIQIHIARNTVCLDAPTQS